MKDGLDLGAVRVKYDLVDIREFPADDFLGSGKPSDLALSVLARDGTQKLAEIAQCAAALDPLERKRALSQLLLLCGLRLVSEEFKIEVRKMSSILIRFFESGWTKLA
jgi:hypothetical protein